VNPKRASLRALPLKNSQTAQQVAKGTEEGLVIVRGTADRLVQDVIAVDHAAMNTGSRY
jgi:hypothetical protein